MRLNWTIYEDKRRSFHITQHFLKFPSFLFSFVTFLPLLVLDSLKELPYICKGGIWLVTAKKNDEISLLQSNIPPLRRSKSEVSSVFAFELLKYWRSYMHFFMYKKSKDLSSLRLFLSFFLLRGVLVIKTLRGFLQNYLDQKQRNELLTGNLFMHKTWTVL